MNIVIASAELPAPPSELLCLEAFRRDFSFSSDPTRAKQKPLPPTSRRQNIQNIQNI